MSLNPIHQQLAKTLSAEFGAEPRVDRFSSLEGEHSMDILTVKDRLNNEVSYSFTIGLSDATLYYKNEPVSFALELAAAAYRDVAEFVPNTLAKAALRIAHNRWECQPGTVFKDLGGENAVPNGMRHLYFIRPLLWKDRLEKIQHPEKRTAWLICMPISDAELNYLLQHGATALESIFQKENVDLFNWTRTSCL